MATGPTGRGFPVGGPEAVLCMFHREERVSHRSSWSRGQVDILLCFSQKAKRRQRVSRLMWAKPP